MSPSMEEVLRQKDARIAKLECEKQRHLSELAALRTVIGTSRIKHEKHVYWLRLECDTVLQAKESVEDRLADLLRGLRKMEGDEDDSLEEPPVCLDGSYVLSLRTQLEKAVQTVAILNNQVAMIKNSYEEVVNSLQEEIGEVVEEKCRMEMDFMNQLVKIDVEKREMEESFLSQDVSNLNESTDSGESGPEESDFEESNSEDSFSGESDDDERIEPVSEASISDISDEENHEKELQLLKRIVNLGLDQKKKLAEELLDPKDEKADESAPLAERVNPVRSFLHNNPNSNA